MQLPEPVHCLVIAPHPDDSEFGISGTVAQWTAEGKKVAYVICTNGDKGSSDPTMTSERLVEIREKEQLAAAEIVGVKDVVFLCYPDQGLEDTAEFRKDLVRQIRYFRPEIVAGPDPYRRYVWHRDHRICGQVMLDAVFPYARDRLAYPDLDTEGYLPHKVKTLYLWGSPDVNLRIDISATFEKKLAALKCHRSQFDMAEMEKHVRLMYKASDEAGCAFTESFHKEEVRR
jgi:LmbE family N-acetylglucosaminyl deacetylase